MFEKQPGGQEKGADWNYVTMPSRNFACITEVPDDHMGNDAPANGNGVNGTVHINSTGKTGKARPKAGKDGHSPLHAGEEGAGTQHPAADGISSEGPLKGGLSVSIRVEIDNRDREGKTEGYGMTIPTLALASKDKVGSVGHPQLHNTTAAPENMTRRQ
ncbi:hypothetical protein LTR40_010258 [Exophiala xenobiotica]|nr:hypothetical protein LTR40_010258 [Exophiala xenobiotica]